MRRYASHCPSKTKGFDAKCILYYRVCVCVCELCVHLWRVVHFHHEQRTNKPPRCTKYIKVDEMKMRVTKRATFLSKQVV